MFEIAPVAPEPGLVVPATFFAGVVVRNGSPAVPDSRAEAVRVALSRRADDSVRAFRRGPAAVFSVNTGALVRPSSGIDAPGGLSIIAGEPFVHTNGLTADLQWMHARWSEGDFDASARACGTFCGVHVSRTGEQLTLVTDRVGLRPIYFMEDGPFLYFATSLRVFEALTELPKTMDLQSLVTDRLLGHTIGDRTRYANVKVLLSGELLETGRFTTQRRRYWRLEDVGSSTASYDAQVDEVYERFLVAVTRRLQGDRCCACFLSGGLDSRAIVAELHQRGCRLLTFNFARQGTLDRALGDAFAVAARTLHFPQSMPPGPARWSQLMSSALDALPSDLRRAMDRPNVAWSGDGGSVGLGHVLSGAPFAQLMRERKIADAARAYLDEQRAYIPARFFVNEVSRRLDGDLFAEIVSGLSDVRCEDPGRSFWAWRMLNDQRHHLFQHFEDLDLHRLELLLPFYDGELLATIAATPVDRCSSHGLYADLLGRFPAIAREVPWQTYPGAVPCPIPVPPNLHWQWDDSGAVEAFSHRMTQITTLAQSLGRSERFPHSLLRPSQVALAATLHLSGLRDYRAELELVGAITHAYEVSEGRVAPPRGL